jgi:5'(3')-deoxyribonucleotidase
MKNSEYVLFLDMDGVLVDYSSGWWAIAKQLKLKKMGNSDEFDKKDISRVHNQTIQHAFWASLGWEYGGEELWKAANDLFENIHILTSTAAKEDQKKHKIVEGGKMSWIKEHLTHIDPQNVHVVPEGLEKAKFATPLSILVDDRPSTIRAFIKAGGFGILHKSKQYRHTIHELEEVSEPMNLGEIAKRLPIVRRGLWNRK